MTNSYKTTIFAAQSVIYTYLHSNKPPSSDGIYTSLEGFWDGSKITMKRKSKKSGIWISTFEKTSGDIIKVEDWDKLSCMQKLLDAIDN